MADTQVPDFVRDFITQQLAELQRGMRIRYVIPMADLVQLILDQIELDN